MQIIEIATASIPDTMRNSPVERVNLEIGKLAAIVPESLRFCFEIAIKETPLEGAELHIEEIPVRARCKDCNHEWALDSPAFSCSSCKSGSITLLSGRELDIKSIEIADEDSQDD